MFLDLLPLIFIICICFLNDCVNSSAWDFKTRRRHRSRPLGRHSETSRAAYNRHLCVCVLRYLNVRIPFARWFVVYRLSVVLEKAIRYRMVRTAAV